MFFSHFDVFCDILLNRRTATWNSFVVYLRGLTRSGFVCTAVPNRTLRVIVRVLNTINKNKRIGIFSSEIDVYYSSYFFQYPPNPVAVVSFKLFWFMIKNQAQLSAL